MLGKYALEKIPPFLSLSWRQQQYRAFTFLNKCVFLFLITERNYELLLYFVSSRVITPQVIKIKSLISSKENLRRYCVKGNINEELRQIYVFIYICI